VPKRQQTILKDVLFIKGIHDFDNADNMPIIIVLDHLMDLFDAS